jgi:hypothetical protein
MITMAPWWTMVLGRKQLFLVSMFLFIVGSVLAGTSKTFGQLIFYRVLQGIDGGSLMPCSQAIARETFPPAEQGMAMAIYSMGVVTRPGDRSGGRRLANRQLWLAVGLLHQRSVLCRGNLDGERVRA